MKTMMTIVLLLGVTLTATSVEAGEPCSSGVGCKKLIDYANARYAEHNERTACLGEDFQLQLSTLNPSDPLASEPEYKMQPQGCL